MYVELHAASAFSFLDGASLPEACVLANHAAGLVVAQLGTAAATAAELEASLEDLPA